MQMGSWHLRSQVKVLIQNPLQVGEARKLRYVSEVIMKERCHDAWFRLKIFSTMSNNAKELLGPIVKSTQRY